LHTSTILGWECNGWKLIVWAAGVYIGTGLSIFAVRQETPPVWWTVTSTILFATAAGIELFRDVLVKKGVEEEQLVVEGTRRDVEEIIPLIQHK
jgi:hypothetical protein